MTTEVGRCVERISGQGHCFPTLIQSFFFGRCSWMRPLRSTASWSRRGTSTRFRSRSRVSILGLRLHAERSTTAPFSVQSLTDILDLADDGEFVCSADRAKSIEDEQLGIRRTWYTFPVFTDDYKSVALVVSHSLQVKSPPPCGVGRVCCHLQEDKKRLAACDDNRTVHQLTALALPAVTNVVGTVSWAVRHCQQVALTPVPAARRLG
jgi:hypothetical protein